MFMCLLSFKCKLFQVAVAIAFENVTLKKVWTNIAPFDLLFNCTHLCQLCFCTNAPKGGCINIVILCLQLLRLQIWVLDPTLDQVMWVNYIHMVWTFDYWLGNGWCLKMLWFNFFCYLCHIHSPVMLGFYAPSVIGVWLLLPFPPFAYGYPLHNLSWSYMIIPCQHSKLKFWFQAPPQMRTSLLLGFEFCDFEGLSQIVEVMIFNELVFSMHTNQIKSFDKGKSLF
jgi:hypothetical protein